MWILNNVTHNHGETGLLGSWILILRRRRWSEGSHRVARGETCQVAETMGLFNVALNHMRGDVVRDKGRVAYLRKACPERRVGGGGDFRLPIVQVD